LPERRTKSPSRYACSTRRARSSASVTAWRAPRRESGARAAGAARRRASCRSARSSSRRRSRGRRARAGRAYRAGRAACRRRCRWRSRATRGNAASSLRLRLGLLLARRAAPRLCRLGVVLDAAQAALEVVEHEADRGLRARRRDDPARALADDEDAPVDGRRLELRQLAVAAGAEPFGRPQQLGGGLRELAAPLLAVERRRRDPAPLV